MNRKDFQTIADEMKDEIEDGDYQADDITSIPLIRIHQAQTQNPPENSEEGMFYSPNAGFIQPSNRMLITILAHTSFRHLWPKFSMQLKYIVCRCMKAEFTQAYQGTGVISIEEEGRWLAGHIERECVRCPYNRFRNRTMPALDELLYSGKPLSTENQCRSGKLFAGVFLPESSELAIDHIEGVYLPDSDELSTKGVFLPEPGELSVENAIPFMFQVGASVRSNAYSKYLNSWIGIQGSLKLTRPPLPLNSLKIAITTQEIETPNGSAWMPMFRVVGRHLGMMEVIRTIETTYQGQLALKDAEVQPELEEEKRE